MKGIKLYDHQLEAIKNLKSGSILCGGVGSGKSLAAIAYYYSIECGGSLEPFGPMLQPRDLYIITTATKRDRNEWEKEASHFILSRNPDSTINNTKLVIDSWNNIQKYFDVKKAFFIFDEQRVVGSGAWSKSFIKIAKENHWILLTATPGDTWLDYIAVFVANGFYKNRTEFLRRHVVFNHFSTYPKVDHFVDVHILQQHRKDLLVMMDYKKKTKSYHKNIIVGHDSELYEFVSKRRWNIYTNLPIANITELCFTWRRIINSDPERLNTLATILKENKKVIVFYNFNFELDLLRELGDSIKVPYREWNGHKHEQIPNTDRWMYLVQYNSGAEGWNCIETNVMVFYSQNYSYKMMHQAAGRIDRLNTPFENLYYYYLVSEAKIDKAISLSLKNKKDFNENDFVNF